MRRRAGDRGEKSGERGERGGQRGESRWEGEGKGDEARGRRWCMDV